MKTTTNSFNDELNLALQKHAATTSTEQSEQIAEAISASPDLTTQMNELAALGKFTGVQVVSESIAANIPRPGPFGAWISGTVIMMIDAFLAALQQNRIHDVRHANDIYPNNSTFVIGHLAYHLKANLDTYSFARSLPKEEFIRKIIENEACAFIESWNYAVDAATKSNNGLQLSHQQVATLFFNLRYRFVFLPAFQQQAENKLTISPSGFIEKNEASIKAIVSILKKTQVTDIQ